MTRGLTLGQARYHGHCSLCGLDIIPGDRIATQYGRARRVHCYRCVDRARRQEATDIDHRMTAHAAARRLKPPEDAP